MSAVLKLAPTKPKVEKGIPLPRRMSRTELYPFYDMLAGDSFFVACTTDCLKVAASIRGGIRNFSMANKQGGYRFTTRIVQGGVRCWRVK